MRADTENETASYLHEAAGKCKQRSDSLTRTDLVNQDNWSDKFATFVVGVGIGALVGILFAPASGKKTRNYITRTVKHGLADAALAGKRWSRQAQDTVDDMKSNVVNVVEAGQKAYRTARDA